MGERKLRKGGGIFISQREKEIKRMVDEFGIEPLDLEDGVQLPNMSGWWAGFDYNLFRARKLEEIAEELGAFPRRARGEPGKLPD